MLAHGTTEIEFLARQFPGAGEIELVNAMDQLHKHLVLSSGEPVLLQRTLEGTSASLFSCTRLGARCKREPMNNLLWEITDNRNIALPRSSFIRSYSDDLVREGDYFVSLDVNAQFLAVASQPLGMGRPLIKEVDDTIAFGWPMARKAGYVELADDLDIGEADLQPWVAQGLRDVGQFSWLPMPFVAYLLEQGFRLRIGTVLYWPDSSRVLDEWRGRLSVARTALLDDIKAPGTALALSYVKLMYAKTLGGWMRSTTLNTTRMLRPDWADMIAALARVNLWRALDKAMQRPVMGKPIAGITDNVVFKVPCSDSVPFVTMSTQPGKWKVRARHRATEDTVNAFDQATGYPCSPKTFVEAVNG